MAIRAENSNNTPENAVYFRRPNGADSAPRVRYIQAAERFGVIQTIDRNIQIGIGRNPEDVDRQLAGRKEAFEKLSLADQKRLLEEARSGITGAVTNLFTENLCLYDELLIEANGKSNEEIKALFDGKKKAFDHARLGKKLELALKMKAEAEDFLLRRFDVYVDEWRTILAGMGHSREKIEQEIERLEDRFLNASQKGQVGITKNLRGRVSDVSFTRFSAFLELYSLQVRQKGLSGDDYPSPEAFQNLYQNGSMAKRGILVEEIHKLTIRALTAKSVNFPSA